MVNVMLGNERLYYFCSHGAVSKSFVSFKREVKKKNNLIKSRFISFYANNNYFSDYFI